MTYAREKKGWRSLSIGNRNFHWRLVPGADSSVLKLRGDSSSTQPVIVLLKDWSDIWLSLGQGGSAPHKPASITPKFVAEAIAFALENNWDPEAKGSPLEFGYNDKRFYAA